MSEKSPPASLRQKLERLELLVDALLEERNGLKAELERVQSRIASSGKKGSGEIAEEYLKNIESLRAQLAEAEAQNRKLIRDRNQVKDRLGQIRDRLGQVEAKLLEQRSASANTRS